MSLSSVKLGGLGDLLEQCPLLVIEDEFRRATCEWVFMLLHLMLLGVVM